MVLLEIKFHIQLGWRPINSEITVNPTQTTTYTTTITDYLGCSNTASIVITVTPNNYSINLGPDLDICVNDTLALTHRCRL